LSRSWTGWRLAWLVLPLLAAGLWTSTPARLEYRNVDSVPTPPSHAVIPGAEERISKISEHTPWVVVALHGFSATRQETAPLAEIVAKRLNANLFEARLSGHGHVDKPMDGVLAEHWLADAASALELGASLGDKIIVIGTSTGATLATAMLDQAIAERIDTFVMISPNFAPSDPTAKWATRPAGPLLARLIIGETTCWEPRNELQAQFWSTCYPTAASIEVMRLVDYANRQLPAKIPQRLLVFYSRDDQVVSADAVRNAFDNIESPQKQLVEISDSADSSNHVLAGDIVSPNTTQRMAETISEFIERPIP
jgi:esterase/lipase